MVNIIIVTSIFIIKQTLKIMKKLILVALILFTKVWAANAQQVNADLPKIETASTEMTVSKINLNSSHFSFEKNVLQSAPDPEPAYDKAYYLKKSRNNRIASLCLVGGGLVIAGIGALTFPKNYDPLWENESDTESKADASTALIVVGIAAMLSSIPFTVMSSVNKRKANLMVSSQKTGFGVPPNVGKHITGITMAISIGK
jgi:hypothetical protein